MTCRHSVQQLCEHLREKAVDETAITIFEEESISGAIFTRLTDVDLKDLIPQDYQFRWYESVWTSAMFLIIFRIDRCAVAN